MRFGSQHRMIPPGPPLSIADPIQQSGVRFRLVREHAALSAVYGSSKDYLWTVLDRARVPGMSTPRTPKANHQALLNLEREYPASQWSCSEIRTADFRAMDTNEDPNELDVTFQRYSDDAEDRYVIADGKATLI